MSNRSASVGPNLENLTATMHYLFGPCDPFYVGPPHMRSLPFMTVVYSSDFSADEDGKRSPAGYFLSVGIRGIARCIVCGTHVMCVHYLSVLDAVHYVSASMSLPLKILLIFHI